MHKASMAVKPRNRIVREGTSICRQEFGTPHAVLFLMTCPHSPVQPFWSGVRMRRKGRKAKSRKIMRPKTKLGLPDLDQSKAAVIGSLRSSESQRGHGYASTNSSTGIVPKAGLLASALRG